MPSCWRQSSGVIDLDHGSASGPDRAAGPAARSCSSTQRSADVDGCIRDVPAGADLIYAGQFFFFATHQSTTDLEEGAKWFNETAAAKDDDPPLLIAMGSIGQLSNLYAINAAAKGEKTRQASGTLYTTHSRTVNDMIQYVLYHRAFQS